MTEGYCVKCKANRPILNGVEDRLKNGRKTVRGKCPTCGDSIVKIVTGPPGTVESRNLDSSPQAASR